GRNHVPRRVRRARLRDSVLVGRDVVIPERALAPVADRELPRLLDILLALEQPLLLLLAAYVKEELEDDRVGLRKQAFEVRDLTIAPSPHRLRDELMNADDENVLVMRPVEDPDLAARRNVRMHAPEEVVRQLLLARNLERRYRDAARVHRVHYVL